MTRTGTVVSAVRVGAVGRMIWGAAMLAAPGPFLRGLGGQRSDAAVATLRVLGVRHLAQGAVTVWRPSGAVVAVGAAADALHAASAVLLAALDRHQRGPALVETGTAATWIWIAATVSRPRTR